ncbi:MAG: HAMP domain-containing protein [Candidatus Omnitrophota bacterium]
MLTPIKNSLGAKIIVLLAAVLIAVFSVISFITFSAQKNILLNQGFKEANDLGDTILTGIRYPMIEGDQDIIQMHFDNISRLSGIKSISLLDNQGVIKRSTDRNMLEKRAISPLVEDALAGRESHGIEPWGKTKQKVFSEAIPIRNEKECVICHGKKQDILGVLNISLDWQPVLRIINDSRNLTIAVSAIGLILISIAVIFLLLKIVIHPIRIVEQGLRLVSEGNLKHKLPVNRSDEIGTVSKMFNQMTLDISNFINLEKELRYAEQLKSKEIAESLSLIKATLEATTDGILVVDNKGVITRYNHNFLEIWAIEENILKSGGDKVALAEAFKQVENPDEFIKKVEKIYSQPDSESFDIIKFKDGRILERNSKPQKIGKITVGRVWSFRDITERKQMEEAFKNKMNELERFNQFVVGREMKMKDLKEQMADLKEQLLKHKPLE